MKNFLKQIKYLLEYIILIICVFVMRLMGIDRSASMCAYIGKKIGPMLSVTKVARRNIEDNLKLKNSDKIINDLWDNFGRFIGEFPFITSLSDQEIKKRVTLEGLEHIKHYQQINQPFLIFSGHFANWELAMRISDKLYPKLAAVYRHANNPYINKFINMLRNKLHMKFILKGPNGLKDMVKSIKDGYSLALLVDQKMKRGIKVPFFGKEVMTNFGIAKFALGFNYPIIPMQIVRTHGSYFRIIFYPAINVENISNDVTGYHKIMIMINQYLETWIKENPHQWLCFHKRWD